MIYALGKVKRTQNRIPSRSSDCYEFSRHVKHRNYNIFSGKSTYFVKKKIINLTFFAISNFQSQKIPKVSLPVWNNYLYKNPGIFRMKMKPINLVKKKEKNV